MFAVQDSFKSASNDKVKFSGPVRSGVQGEFPKVSPPEQPSGRAQRTDCCTTPDRT